MNKTTYEQQLAEKGQLIYTTVGFSMRPFLRSGEDMVLIERKPQARCRKYDAVLYRRPSGKYVLHRIVKVREGDYVLCGDNCWDREPGVTDDQILGVLTAVIRKGQKIDVQQPKYRLAVRIWCALYPVRAVVIYTRGKIWNIWKRIKARRNPS